MKNVVYSKVQACYEIIYRDTPSICQTPPHTHNVVEVYLNLSYLPNALVGNQVSAIGANTLILCPAFCPHQFFTAVDESYERYILSADIAWLESVLPDNKLLYEYLKDAEHPMILPLDEPTCRNLKAQFDGYLAIRRTDSFSALAAFFDCMAVIDSIIMSANREKAGKKRMISGTQQTVNDVISYINEHISESITLADLSSHFFLNPDYISRLFKKHTNTTLSNYITLQKMTRAQTFLREGQSIEQVQLATGYGSYAHFLRTFKKHAGIPPGEYQKRHLAAKKALSGNK